MASKLHRGGGTKVEAAPWELRSVVGVQPVGGQRPAPSAGPRTPSDPDGRIGEIERQAEAKVQAAYQRGLQEGGENGRKQGAAQLQTAVERFAKSVHETASLKSGLRHEAEEDVVRLALAIAKRVLHREISTSPEALQGLVRAALDKLDGREIYRLRVHPQDAPAIEAQLRQFAGPRNIQVQADAALERGSAVFETAHGALDASVDTQLCEIERGFADLIRHAP